MEAAGAEVVPVILIILVLCISPRSSTKDSGCFRNSQQAAFELYEYNFLSSLLLLFAVLFFPLFIQKRPPFLPFYYDEHFIFYAAGTHQYFLSGSKIEDDDAPFDLKTKEGSCFVIKLSKWAKTDTWSSWTIET